MQVKAPIHTVAHRLAVSRLREVVTRHPLVTFRPSAPFAGLDDEPGKKILIRAANRVGKTRHVARYVAKRMIEEPGLRARVVGPTSDHIHNVLGQYLSEFLGPYLSKNSYYVEGRGWNGGRSRTILLANGSVCELRSLRDDPDSHSGRSCHVVAFDEPPTLAHYTENAARLVDTGGVMIIAATMVNRPVQWLRKMVQGTEPDPEDGRTVHGTGWVHIVAKFSRENCPWYPEQQIEDWLEVMEATPWDRGQRVEAKWDGVTPERRLVGITERCFSADAPTGKVSIELSFDHGEVVGHQTALLMAFRGSRCWVIDEYVNPVATSPEEDAHEVLEMLRLHRIDPTRVDLAVGDINGIKGYGGWKMNEALQAAFAQQLRRATPPFLIQTPDKTPGSVDWGLRCLNFAGRRGDLHIHRRCVQTTAAVKHWKGDKEDAYIHLIDTLRYGVTSAVGHHKTYAQLRFE